MSRALPTRGDGEYQGWRYILWLDLALLVLVRRWERTTATRLMRTLTRLGDTSTWVAITFIVGLSGGPGPDQALHMATAATLTLAVTQILKRACRRSRPSVGRGIRVLADNPDAFSFPSGHTAVAFAVAVALAGPGDGLSELFGILAGGIAVSRVYLGAHYPLDVVVGALVGASVGWVARLPAVVETAGALVGL